MICTAMKMLSLSGITSFRGLRMCEHLHNGGNLRQICSRLVSISARTMIRKEQWKASLGPNGMDEWLCSIKDTGRVRLLWHDWEKVIT